MNEVFEQQTKCYSRCIHSLKSFAETYERIVQSGIQFSIVHPTIAHHSINFAQLLHQRFKIRYGNYLEGIRVEQMQLATSESMN